MICLYNTNLYYCDRHNWALWTVTVKPILTVFFIIFTSRTDCIQTSHSRHYTTRIDRSQSKMNERERMSIELEFSKKVKSARKEETSDRWWCVTREEGSLSQTMTTREQKIVLLQPDATEWYRSMLWFRTNNHCCYKDDRIVRWAFFFYIWLNSLIPRIGLNVNGTRRVNR